MPIPPDLKFPVGVEIIPGRLRAIIHRHKLGERSCWTYVSDGLRVHGQKELVFTVSQAEGEADVNFPEDPLHFMVQVESFAAQRRLIDAGGLTEFGERGLLGFGGLAYARPQPFDGIPFDWQRLQVVPITKDELAVAKEQGLTRVLAKLGQTYRYYPYAPWCERGRASVITKETVKESLLERAPIFGPPGVLASMDGDRLRVRVIEAARLRIAEALGTAPVNAPLVLLCEADPEASKCLVFDRSVPGPCAIENSRKPSSRLTGSFVAFIPEQPEDGSVLLEDGFAVTLTGPTWAKIKAAFIAGDDLELEARGKTFFELDGLDTYPGEPLESERPRAIRVMRAVLLVTEPELRERLGPEALDAFVKTIDQAVKAELAGSLDTAEGLRVNVTLRPSDGPIWRVERGSIGNPEAAVATLARLQKLPAPGVKGGDVGFEITFTTR
jgi:hypothetical protein